MAAYEWYQKLPFHLATCRNAVSSNIQVQVTLTSSCGTARLTVIHYTVRLFSLSLSRIVRKDKFNYLNARYEIYLYIYNAIKRINLRLIQI